MEGGGATGQSLPRGLVHEIVVHALGHYKEIVGSTPRLAWGEKGAVVVDQQLPFLA